MNRKKKKFIMAFTLMMIVSFSTSCRTVPVYAFTSSDPNAVDLVRTKRGATITNPDGTTITLSKDGRWASDNFWEKTLRAVKFGNE